MGFLMEVWKVVLIQCCRLIHKLHFVVRFVVLHRCYKTCYKVQVLPMLIGAKFSAHVSMDFRSKCEGDTEESVVKKKKSYY